MVYLWNVQHQQRPKECVDICVCTYTHERTNPIPCLFPEQLTSCNQKILYFVCVKEIRWVLDMAVHHCRVIRYLCEIIKILSFSNTSTISKVAYSKPKYIYKCILSNVFYFMFLFNHSLHHNLVTTFFVVFLKKPMALFYPIHLRHIRYWIRAMCTNYILLMMKLPSYLQRSTGNYFVNIFLN